MLWLSVTQGITWADLDRHGRKTEDGGFGPQYCGAFVRDLDGHKIEAMFWDDAAG
jgi:hypothetical protein